MKTIPVKLNKMTFSNDAPFFLMAGINVLESSDLALKVAEHFANICQKLEIPYIFKASFDKANRSSIHSFRGPGIQEGLKILRDVKEKVGVPIITDIHEASQAKDVAEVADILGIPAFLCRQTNLLAAAAETKKILNIKKMQMMSPFEIKNIYKKLEELTPERNFMICERGFIMGYNNLVVDPLSFPIMKEFGYPVTFDVTHALQMPGGLGEKTAGRGKYTFDLARAGISQGIAGLYLEAHPDPTQAKCDGPCALKLSEAEKFLRHMKELDNLIKEQLA